MAQSSSRLVHYALVLVGFYLALGAAGLGMGDKIDESKMTSLAAGSFAYLDPNMHHYVEMKGATVVQIHGASPLQFSYVNPSDDQRNKK